jgi:small GTP-binding protein
MSRRDGRGAGARPSRSVKLVLLGDAGVGKSSLAQRFVAGSFKPYNESTVGASFMSKLVMVDDTPFKYQIWDTAGQEKYRSLAPMYYKGAAACVLVYDITKPHTFETLKDWVAELQTHGPKDIVITIAGNKADLAVKRKVDAASAQSFAETVGAEFVETSAKDDLNVAQVFNNLARRLPVLEEPRPSDSVSLGQTPRSQQNQRGCC